MSKKTKRDKTNDLILKLKGEGKNILEIIEYFADELFNFQHEFADKAGISAATLSLILNGHSTPSDLTKQRICNAIGCDISILFPGAKDWHPLKTERILKLMSQKTLTKKSGISQVSISFMETGRTVPMIQTSEVLFEAVKS